MINEKSNSVISLIVLTLLILISFTISSNQNLEKFCNQDLECTLELIIETKNSLYCDQLEDSKYCYLKSASILDNPNLCTKSNNESLCITQLAVSNLAPETCNLLEKSQINKTNLELEVTPSNDSLNKDLCVFQVSISKNKASDCEYSTKKDFCYYSYALAKQDLKACELSEKYKNTCILRINNETT